MYQRFWSIKFYRKMWQEILVGVIVLAALAYLVKKYFFKSKNEAGCDKCAKP